MGGVFTLALAKHSRSFNLINSPLSEWTGFNRTSEPMEGQVEN
jgi:hypothetical protein